MTQEDTLAGATLHIFLLKNPSSFSAEEYMETLQLRLDEDSTNGFFEAVFFPEDPVFWEVCHLGLFEVKHT